MKALNDEFDSSARLLSRLVKRDTHKFSAAGLFVKAADRLRNEFNDVVNPHPGDKGAEVQEKFRRFLNERIPKRFQAGQGLIVDHDGGISLQQDVIIFDSLVSLVYRESEHKLILPIDNVPAVIEVKSRLDATELADAYRKISSCKRLEKRPASASDRSATGTDLKAVGTLGIIFAYSSTLKIRTVAEKARQLNETYDSGLWPDAIVLLDRGIITYDMRTPAGQRRAIHMRPEEPGTQRVHLPFYIEMAIREDKAYVLNRFFSLLFDQLANFPYRPSSPPPGALIDGAPLKSESCCVYQFNPEQKLVVAEHRDDLGTPHEFIITSSQESHIGELSFEQRNDGGVVKWRGDLPDDLMSFVLGRLLGGSPVPLHNYFDGFYTNVLAVTAEDFREWPNQLNGVIPGLTWKLAQILGNRQADVYCIRLFLALKGHVNGALDHRKDDLAAFGQIHGRILAALVRLSELLCVPFRLLDLLPDFLIEYPLSEVDTGNPGKVLIDILASLVRLYGIFEIDIQAALFGAPEENQRQLYPEFYKYLESVRTVWLDKILSTGGLKMSLNSNADSEHISVVAKQQFDDIAALIENSLIYLLEQQLILPWSLAEIPASDRKFKISPRFQISDTARRKWKPQFKRAAFEEL